MVYVLEESHVTRGLALLTGKLPLCTESPGRDSGFTANYRMRSEQNKNNSLVGKDGPRPQHEEGSLLHTRTRIHTLTASFGIKGSKDG